MPSLLQKHRGPLLTEATHWMSPGCSGLITTVGAPAPAAGLLGQGGPGDERKRPQEASPALRAQLSPQPGRLHTTGQAWRERDGLPCSEVTVTPGKDRRGGGDRLPSRSPLGLHLKRQAHGWPPAQSRNRSLHRLGSSSAPCILFQMQVTRHSPITSHQLRYRRRLFKKPISDVGRTCL